MCYRTTVFQSMKLGIDVNRHKEVIVKAISGLILLMLKNFKLNHIYQVRVAYLPAISYIPGKSGISTCNIIYTR